MKRLSMIAMAALLVMAMSCKKNDEDIAQGPGFRASMENQAGDSKTHLEGTKVKWDDGDAILVVNSNGIAKEFTLEGTAPAEGYAEFQSEEATEVFYHPGYTAYYPSSIYTAPGRVTLPETQYYKEDSFERGFNPMAAQSTENTLEFKNLCGILALQLTGSCTVTSIRITAKGGEKLWGTGNISMSGTDASMTPTLGALTGGTSTLTLNCGTGVTLTSTATTFYFVLPAGSLASGFDVLLTDSDHHVWKRSASAGHNTAITRSNIKTMAELPVVPQDPVVANVAIATGCIDCTYTLGGEVNVPEEGGPFACEFGIVYSVTDETPTIEEGASKIIAHSFSDTPISYVADGTDFTIDLAELPEDEKLYFCTYAIIDGVVYSETQTVLTGVPRTLPTEWTNNGGKNPHPFTVGEGKVVYFSQGNLQYNATGSSATAASGENVGGTWRFAEQQFDVIGAANANAAQTYDGWIDLFGWGTSGYNHGATCYQPWSTSTTYSDYYAYGSSSNHLYSSDGTADWGANAISNGGGSSWRTLTNAEWVYLIDTRTDGSNKLLYGEGKVGNCTPGLIILPDDWSCPTGLTDVVRGESSWSNVYSYSQWAQLEAAGAVFLPAAGDRDGTSVEEVGLHAHYWSSSYDTSISACYVHFRSEFVLPNNVNLRWYGYSVRLVSEN